MLKPMNKKVLIKRDEGIEQSDGGIIYHKKQGSPQGVVIDAGNCPYVKAGDRVLMTEYAGNTVEVDGEKFYLVEDKLILAVLEDE